VNRLLNLNKKILFLLYSAIKKIWPSDVIHDGVGFKVLLLDEDESKGLKKINWYIPGVNIQNSDHTAEVSKQLKQSDHFDRILLSKAAMLYHRRVLFNIGKSVLVDPNFYSNTEASAWSSIYYLMLDSTKKDLYKQQSVQNYKKFLAKNIDKNKAILFGTGPSIDQYDQIGFDHSWLKIICNSIIKNRDFMESVRPDAITIADPVFHFGSNPYAEKFRIDLVERCIKYDFFIFAPSFNVPLLVEHYPEIKHRIIGLEYGNSIKIPTLESLEVKGTDNIFTLFMLPVSASVAQSVYCLGMDGRKKSESYFWEHHHEYQYLDLIPSVKDAHPSFFRDRNYSKYSKKHCNNVEKHLKFLKRKYDVDVYSLSRSSIPALDNNYIKNVVI